MVWTAQRTGLSAGGYNNCVAFDRNLQDHIICGGDTFGMNESFDGGDTWWPANLGLYSGAVGVGGILSVPGGDLWATLGSGGSPARTVARGVVETDGSGNKFTRWEQRPVFPGIFYGGGNAPWLPAGDPRPRACGRQMAVNDAGTLLYAIPYTNGVWRSSDEFGTTTNTKRIVAPAAINQKLQTIITDPTDDTRLLVGTWRYGEAVPDGGVLITNAHTAGVDGAGVTPLTNSPPTVLEFCSIGDNVYAACGWYGVYRVTGASWNTWTKISSASWPTATPGVSNEPYAVGIDGFNDGTDDWLFVTICNPPQLSGDPFYTSVMRCQGANQATPGAWETMTGETGQFSATVLGSGEPWWVSVAQPSFMPTKGTGDMENVACDPFDQNKVHIVGRAGGHQIRNSKVTKLNVRMNPAVYGQSGTTTVMLLADPGRLNHIYTGNTDHIVVGSGSDMAPGTVERLRPAGTAADQATWLDIGPDGKLYAFCGKRDWYRDGVPEAGTSVGEIYRYEGDPITASTTSLGLNAATPAHDKPGGGLVTGTAATPIVVAGVIGRGIWRKVGGGAWSQVVANTVFSTSPTKTDRFPTAKDIDGDTVFMVDKEIGLFRSLDQGATWKGPNGSPNPGCWWPGGGIITVGVDPLNVGRMYVCKSSGVWMIGASDVLATNPATSAIRITPTTGVMTSLQGMAIDRATGDMYVWTKPSATEDAQVWVATHPTGPFPAWTRLDGAELFIAAGAYSLNHVTVDSPDSQMFAMPGGVWMLEEGAGGGGGGANGIHQGGSRFLLIRSTG